MDVTGLSHQTVSSYLQEEFKQEQKGGIEKGTAVVPASQVIETKLGSEVVERFRKEILEEQKLSPEEKSKCQAEKQRRREERKQKLEENKRKRGRCNANNNQRLGKH
jgi:hypothetical protein